MAFNKGDRVHVEFDGEINETRSGEDAEYIPEGQGQYDNYGDWGFVEVRDDTGTIHLIWVNGDRDFGPEVIEAVEPSNWPPRAGDIWSAEDKEYFVIDSAGARVSFAHNVKTDSGTVYATSNMSLVLFAAIEPELIRRRES